MSSIFKIGIIFAALLHYNVLTSYYEPPPKDNVIIGYHGKNGSHLGEIHPFKISTEYDVNRSMKSLNERNLNYVKSVVEEALLPFANLKIRQEPFIFLNHTCDEHRKGGQVKCRSNCNVTKCGSMEIPAKYLGSCIVEDTLKIEEGVGANAHFLLFVSLGEIVKNCDKDEVFSIAAHCQQGVMDRPVAGYLDICPDKVIDPKLRSRVVKELTHDILHILAFSQSLYPFFHDSNGNPRTPRNKETNLPPMEDSSFFIAGESTIGNVSRNWLSGHGFVKREVKMLVTETVANKAKEHFGCYDLEGADLEDGGGVRGFEMTHFEKRLFKNEIMTGTHNEVDEEYVFSELTLAVLQDSGWYIVNFANAEPLAYAQGVGCKFVRTSCLEWVRTRCPNCFNPYCDELKNVSDFRREMNKRCSKTRRSVVNCSLTSHSNELDRMFQYLHADFFFENRGVHNYGNTDKAPRLGGPDALFDYCPIYTDFKWKLKSSRVVKSICADVRGNYKNNSDWHEVFGDKSICVDFVKPWVKKHCKGTEHPEGILGGCYKYECHGKRLYLGVKYKNLIKYYLCPKKGHTINIYRRVSGGVVSGTIVCPDCSELCSGCVTKDLTPSEKDELDGDRPIQECTRDSPEFEEMINRLRDSNNKILQRFYPKRTETEYISPENYLYLILFLLFLLLLLIYMFLLYIMFFI